MGCRGRDLNPHVLAHGGFELYWLLSADVHSVVPCSAFPLSTCYFVRACSPEHAALAVKLAVRFPGNAWGFLSRVPREPGYNPSRLNPNGLDGRQTGPRSGIPWPPLPFWSPNRRTYTCVASL